MKLDTQDVLTEGKNSTCYTVVSCQGMAQRRKFFTTLKEAQDFKNELVNEVITKNLTFYDDIHIEGHNHIPTSCD